MIWSLVMVPSQLNSRLGLWNFMNPGFPLLKSLVICGPIDPSPPIPSLRRGAWSSATSPRASARLRYVVHGLKPWPINVQKHGETDKESGDWTDFNHCNRPELTRMVTKQWKNIELTVLYSAIICYNQPKLWFQNEKWKQLIYVQQVDPVGFFWLYMKP